MWPQEFTIYDKKDVAAGLQNFLICLEMFPAAVAHAFAFPPRDYLDPAQQGKRGITQSLRAMFDVRDVMEDMNLVVDDTVCLPSSSSSSSSSDGCICRCSRQHLSWQRLGAEQTCRSCRRKGTGLQV